MPEKQGDSSEPSRNPSTDKPKHQRGTNGWEVPRDYAHALHLDVQNCNNKWKDAIDLEIEHIMEHQVFKDHGKVEYEKGKVIDAPK